MPVFSIIIPCYNSWSFMTQCLQSLEYQSFKDFEVIFVDDCSTDDTYSQLLNYQRNCNFRTVILRNETNKGPGKSRCYAVSQATGDYIAFMDSDDWYEFDMLEKIFSEIQEKTPDLLFFDSYRCFCSESSFHKIAIHNVDRLMKCQSKEDYIALAPDSLCSIVLKRSLMLTTPMAETYNAEDGVTVALVTAGADSLAILPVPLYNYRYRNSSLSTKIDPNTIDNFWNAFLFLQQHKQNCYKEAIEFRCVQLVVYGMIYNAIRCRLNYNSLNQILDNFEIRVQNWKKNKYVRFLPFRKRVWLYFASIRFFPVLSLYYCLQLFYFKTR